MMKINVIAEKLNLEILTMPDSEREVTGGYVGDLLSWVMGRAEEDQVWITIVTNINILAVASLSGVSAVIIAEGADVSSEIVSKATEQGINLFRSKQTSFDLALALGHALEM